MKYESTSDINIKRHTKTGIYYFVRGRIENSLFTTDWKKAVARKELREAELEDSGEAAMKFSVDFIYEKYEQDKELQSKGLLAKEDKISPGTLREIKYVFKSHLLPFFGKKKLAQVSTRLWAKYCDQVTVSDVANHRKVFNGFFDWAKRKGYTLSKPDITHIPFHRRRKRRIITNAELEKIFSHAEGSLLTFLSLALYNGLRRTEIMTLEWDRVNFEERYVVIADVHNKLRRERSVPINETVANLLAARFASREYKSQWVFPNAKNYRRHADVSGLKTAWGTCLFRAGLKDITWHDFRATFEKHMNKTKEHTDVQKEKFADASMDVQKRIYVNMDHEDLRGLENSVAIPAIEKLISARVSSGKGAGR